MQSLLPPSLVPTTLWPWPATTPVVMMMPNGSLYASFGNSTFANTTFANLNFANTTELSAYSDQFAGMLNVYYTPVLVALGSMGNMASVFIFRNSKLRMQSTSQYLSALAISDTVFLLQLVPPWLNAIHFTNLFHQQYFCQFFVYTSYVSCCLSAWLVVAFTVERFVAVVYPLRRNAVCTAKRARQIIYVLTMAALVLNLPVLRFAMPTHDDCNINLDYLAHAARFNLVDTALSFSAPLVIIMVLNSWITIAVVRLERARNMLLKADTPRPARLAACPRSQQRITRMLLLVSTVFVVLNLPAYTMRLITYYDFQINLLQHESEEDQWNIMQQLALLFFNTNFGINFILYCLSGQNFRRALRQAIPWLRHRVRRGVALRRAPPSLAARASNASTSFASNCTEATTNMGGAGAPPLVVQATPSMRKRGCERFITRWKFDNSRQRRPSVAAVTAATIRTTATDSVYYNAQRDTCIVAIN